MLVDTVLKPSNFLIVATTNNTILLLCEKTTDVIFGIANAAQQSQPSEHISERIAVKVLSKARKEDAADYMTLCWGPL